jgi:hypothetical protein
MKCFTKGPWKFGKQSLGPNPNKYVVIQPCFEKNYLIADCGEDDEGEANARLIAAAPDLLKACSLAHAHIETSGKINPKSIVLKILAQAIRKATNDFYPL